MLFLQRLAEACLGLLLDVLPYFAVGALLAGVVKAHEDRLAFGRRLGNSPRAILLGAVVGVVAPVCSCGVVPIALGLLAGGAGTGPVFAFLAAGPMIHPASFVVTAGVLGPELAVARLAGALLLGTAMGFLGRRLEGHGLVSLPPALRGDDCCCSAPAASGGARLGAVLLQAWKAFVEMLRYLAAGVFLGGLLEVLLDPEVLVSHVKGPVAVVAAAAAGLPLYLCSCSEVPVALSLVRKGLEPAAILAFLLAGPGISVFSLALLSSILRPRALAAYAAMFLAGSVIIGLVFGAIFP